MRTTRRKSMKISNFIILSLITTSFIMEYNTVSADAVTLDDKDTKIDFGGGGQVKVPLSIYVKDIEIHIGESFSPQDMIIGIGGFTTDPNNPNFDPNNPGFIPNPTAIEGVDYTLITDGFFDITQEGSYEITFLLTTLFPDGTVSNTPYTTKAILHVLPVLITPEDPIDDPVNEDTPETPDEEPAPLPIPDNGNQDEGGTPVQEPENTPVPEVEIDPELNPNPVQDPILPPYVPNEKNENTNTPLELNNNSKNSSLSNETKNPPTNNLLTTPIENETITTEKLPETGEADAPLLSISGLIMLFIGLWKIKR